MTSSTIQCLRRLALGATVAGACCVAATPARAQEPQAPVVLLLDKDAIAPGQESGFTHASIHATIAAIGLRDFLPVFAEHVGEAITLPSGQVGSEGWFALTSAPASWATGPDAGDGAANFVSANAGLGTPDESGNGPSSLDNVDGVRPLHAAGLQALIGRSACAVVFADDIPWTPAAASLSGPTLGRVAFRVVGVSGGDGVALPSVEIQILDPTTCSGPLALFADAPTW